MHVDIVFAVNIPSGVVVDECGRVVCVDVCACVLCCLRPRAKNKEAFHKSQCGYHREVQQPQATSTQWYHCMCLTRDMTCTQSPWAPQCRCFSSNKTTSKKDHQNKHVKKGEREEHSTTRHDTIRHDTIRHEMIIILTSSLTGPLRMRQEPQRDFLGWGPCRCGGLWKRAEQKIFKIKD